jgi:hypothetical protein
MISHHYPLFYLLGPPRPSETKWRGDTPLGLALIPSTNSFAQSAQPRSELVTRNSSAHHRILSWYDDVKHTNNSNHQRTRRYNSYHAQNTHHVFLESKKTNVLGSVWRGMNCDGGKSGCTGHASSHRLLQRLEPL